MKASNIFIIILAIFLSHNANAQQSHSEYDKTIDKLIPKATKNKLNEKQLEQLTISYHEANNDDFKRIMELKASGQPDIWIEIYHKTCSINDRQNKVDAFPEEVKTAMNFKHLNLDNEISSCKEKAELYICAKTNLLLKDPTEENLKEAKALINQLYKINPQSRNIDDLRLKLAILPSKQILFRVATPIETYLPQEFAQIILNFDHNTLYGIPFDIIPDKNTIYDLMIRIMIDEKTVSPERIDVVTFEERKGDSKVTVNDKTMIKSGTLRGEIQIIDVKNDEILINTPYDATSTFHYRYAEINGDKNACSEYTLQLLECKPIDFPSDEALLKGAADELNRILKNHYLGN